MKIRSVRTYNINSLKGENFIDFQSGILGETGLFAIIGPTGAGKSTLLDAITLALYNQTPRSGKLSKSAISDFGAIITRSTDEARSEVEYEINGIVYRSMWRISRARTGNLRDYEMELSELDTEGNFQILDLKKSAIPDKNSEIIGLSFDQFVKSILLSQGDFARFLKANANERGELLEKITGTAIYRRIGRAAFAKRGEELKKLDDIQRKLEGVELLTPDERREKKAELKELNTSTKEVQSTHKTLQQTILQKKELKKLGGDIEELTKRAALNARETNQFEEKQQKLALHFQILPLKGEMEKIDLSEKNQRNLLGELDTIKTSLPKLELDLKGKQSQISKTKEEKSLLDSSLVEESKVWTKVRVKDQECLQQKTQFDANLVAVNRTKKEKEQLLSEKKKLTEELLKIKAEQEKSTREGAELKPFACLTEVYTELVTEKNQLDATVQDLQEEIDTHASSKTHTELSALPSIELKKKHVEEALDKASSFIYSTQSAIGDQSLEQLQKAIEIGQRYAATLDQMRELIVLDQTFVKQDKELELTVGQRKKELSLAEKKIVETKQALELERARLKEVRARWERQKLEASYEEARTHLTEGSPCPLCGSVEHPFVASYESVLNKTQDQLTALEASELKLNKEVNQFEVAFSASKTELENLQLRSKECKEHCELNRKKYAELATTIKMSELMLDLEGLTAKSKQVQDKNDANQKRLHQFTILAKAKEKLPVLERLKLFVSRLDAEESRFRKRLSAFPLGQELSITESMNSLLAKKVTLDALQLKIEKDEKRYNESSLLFQEKSLAEQKVEVSLKQNTEEYEKSKQQVARVQKERHELFGEKVVDTEETQLRGKIQLCDKRFANLQMEEAKMLSQLKEWQKSQKDLQLKLTTLEKDLFYLNEELTKRLSVIGLESRAEAQTALLSEEQAALWQKRVKQLEEEQLQIKQSLTDTSKRRDEIQDLKLPEGSISDLEKEFNSLSKQLNEAQQRIGALSNQIAHDKKNREASKVLVEQIEKQQLELNRWSELSSLIGDATGNRFSKFAQELTLEQLLVLANKHLQPLSDRYLLKSSKIGKENELFVVDLYHGNEERSVKTLSGGESFLVSLSLALGLSDLAGQNTRIESLFIDEGFGTLDQETLDTALSTLEKLQHETNRTIGVISHVKELKERITTQIELKRDSSGFSTLEVVG